MPKNWSCTYGLYPWQHTASRDRNALRAFSGIPLESTAGNPKPYKSRHLKPPEHFQNSLPLIGLRLRGNIIRGNKTESLWEESLPLRGPLKISENLWKPLETFWKPLKTSENPPSQRPSQRQISLSEALGPVAPSRVAPWNLCPSARLRTRLFQKSFRRGPVRDVVMEFAAGLRVFLSIYPLSHWPGCWSRNMQIEIASFVRRRLKLRMRGLSYRWRGLSHGHGEFDLFYLVIFLIFCVNFEYICIFQPEWTHSLEQASKGIFENF